MTTVVLVTGATDGIGKQTAIELASRGARVIVHGRTLPKAELAAHEIRRAAPDSRIDVCAADFSSLAEVRRLGELLAVSHPRLDVLINNAGVYMHDRVLTVDGFETTFAVNHLAPFLLTLLLLPALSKSDQGRVVNVSSMAHSRGRLDFDDLDSDRRFDAYQAYATSKLANILFSNELARRLSGTPTTSNALHPGVITTKLLMQGFGSTGASVKQGAATSVKLALDPDLSTTSGRYFSDEREVKPAPASHDEKVQRRLWTVSLSRTAAPDLRDPTPTA